MDNQITNNLGIKLTKKQQNLLCVLSDPLYAKKTNQEKAKIAGVNESYMYTCLKNPAFIQAIRLRGLSEVLCATTPIIKRMIHDGLDGKFMQQKTLMEMGGLHSQQPLVNVILNNNQAPSSDIDNKIIEKIIDITPTSSSVDNSSLEDADI